MSPATGRALSAWRDLEAGELHRALSAINGYRDQQRRTGVFAVVQAKSAAPMRELEAALTHIEQVLATMRRSLPPLSGAKLGRRLQQERIKLIAQLQRRNLSRSPGKPKPCRPLSLGSARPQSRRMR